MDKTHPYNSPLAGGASGQYASGSEATSQEHGIEVYIVNLRTNIEDHSRLEKEIRQSLRKLGNMDNFSVKCYPQYSVGRILVANDDEKGFLLKNYEEVTLDYPNEQTKFSLTDTLEIVSYIVLDTPKSMRKVLLPSADDVTNLWTKYNSGDQISSCDCLDTQFPNIYRLITTSFDELIRDTRETSLTIGDLPAKLYYNADCRFLENLPNSINEDNLRDAISFAAGKSNLSLSSLFIKLNDQTHNACIITIYPARKWLMEKALTIGGKEIIIGNRLNYRLLIRSVPQTSNISNILQHPSLAGKVKGHEQKGDHLILEISDKNAFDDCVRSGAIDIEGKPCLVEAYAGSTDTKRFKGDATDWYQEGMHHYQPDIMQFIDESQRISCLDNWDPQLWLSEFKRSAPNNHGGRSNDRNIAPSSKLKKVDQTRHLLRMTVMLSTLTAVRKESYKLDGQAMKLRLGDRLMSTVYDHASKLEESVNITSTKVPYKQTKVEVVEADCLIVYEHLVQDNFNPLLLNMANATTPGGGYRKGDGAQEENLFRRSDYFRSLDIELDNYLTRRSERFSRTSDCQEQRLADQKRIYPMEEFGAIYTSGLTVFRGPEDAGYPFMKKPLQNVCAVAMAAYREPQLQNNMLAPKYAVGTRKKIENIFAIAYHHKHDSIVLSALGCGAFKNPPDHVADLFQSVIEQYAGFFKLIVFAIINDHNACGILNPEGNFEPFLKLNDWTIQPIEQRNVPNTIVGPYRLLSDGFTVSDVCIYDLPPCQFGAACRDSSNPGHASQFSHPPMCAIPLRSGRCSLAHSPVHMLSFFHRGPCRDGDQCRQKNDEKHCRQFDHLPTCSRGGGL